MSEMYRLDISPSHVYSITLGYFFLSGISLWPTAKTAFVSLINIFCTLVAITCSNELALVILSTFGETSVTFQCIATKTCRPKGVKSFRPFINLHITSTWHITGSYCLFK